MSVVSNIYTILSGTSAVTSKLATWTKSTATQYAIFATVLIPDNISTDTTPKELTTQDTTINFYRSGNIDGAQPYLDTEYTINCRASTEVNALALQSACYDALNRVTSTDGTNHFVCSKLAIIPPADSTDNYNAVVSVRARAACTNQ